MKKILNEFKEFAVKGNALDLAIGVIIGAAFGDIVTSLVNDIIMPPIGLLMGKIDVKGLFVDLSGAGYPSLAAAQEAGAPTLNYGMFLQKVLDFLIVAVVIFTLVRTINRLRRPKEEEAAPEPTTRECPYCLATIPIKAVRCAFCTEAVEPLESV